MKLPNFLANLLVVIFGGKPEPKVEAVLDAVSLLIKDAQPIVADIALLCPNKTIIEAASAYAKYGLPIAGLIDNPVSIGNALLNLGTALLLQRVKTPVALNIAQSAVQLAVTIGKAASA